MAIDSNALDAFRESGGRPAQPLGSRDGGRRTMGKNSATRSPPVLRFEPGGKMTMTSDDVIQGNSDGRLQSLDSRGSGNSILVIQGNDDGGELQPLDPQGSGNLILDPTESGMRLEKLHAID